jgi:hypothetical protein
MLSSSRLKIHEPPVTGVSPRALRASDSARKLRNTRGELRRLNRRIADTARPPGRMPRPSATATTPVLGIARLPAWASLMSPVGSNELVGHNPHGLCHGTDSAGSPTPGSGWSGGRARRGSP